MWSKHFLASILMSVLAGLSPAWGAVDTVAIALAGDPAPGLPGRTFSGFLNITINDPGQVMFGAVLDGSNPSDREGIWYGYPDAPVPLVRQGDPAPGVPNRFFSAFRINDGQSIHAHQARPQHNNAGQAVFVALLDGSAPLPESGIWRGTPGNLELVALSGLPAPGAGGRTFREFVNPLIDESGNVMFLGLLEDFTRGLWFSGPAGLMPLAIDGDPIPGLGGPAYRALHQQQYDLGPAGEIAFTASPGNLGGNVLLYGTPDSFAVVLRTGDPAPDTASNVLLSIASPEVLPGGNLVLVASFDTPTGNDTGVYLGPLDDLQLLVRKGDTVPGTGAPLNNAGQPSANDSGELVFYGFTHTPPSPTDDMIVSGTVNGLELVARTNDPAPGSGGRHFVASPQLTFGPPVINGNGRVAFEGNLPLSSSNGLWIRKEGELEPIAVAHTPFEVRPGDERTVTRINFVSTVHNYGRGGVDGFNDRDEVAFRAHFADGSFGLFVSGIAELSNQPPLCEGAQPSIAELWPPNHKFEPVSILGITDPDGDDVTLEIDRITSDEPSVGPGHPHAPDAFFEGFGTAQLRAERFGEHNGRVYEIHFTASDGTGFCEGSVRVTVPHDAGGGTAIDDGQDHDATAF